MCLVFIWMFEQKLVICIKDKVPKSYNWTWYNNATLHGNTHNWTCFLILHINFGYFQNVVKIVISIVMFHLKLEADWIPQPVPYCISYEFYIARIWTFVCRLSIFLVIFSESPSWLGSLFNPANITQISNMPFLLGLYNWQIILWSSHDTVVWGKNISTY